MMGKAGDLSIRLLYLRAGEEKLRLRANKGKEGDARVGSTIVLSVLFGPLGFLKKGKDAEIAQGYSMTAFIDEDTDLTIPDVPAAVASTTPVNATSVISTPVTAPSNTEAPTVLPPATEPKAIATEAVKTPTSTTTETPIVTEPKLNK
jgi:cell division septation protein DedD